MNVGETGSKKRNGHWPKMSMAVHFRGLASEAGTTPEGDIFGQVRPDIAGGKEPVGSPGEQGHEHVEREHVGDFGEPGGKK